MLKIRNTGRPFPLLLIFHPRRAPSFARPLARSLRFDLPASKTKESSPYAGYFTKQRKTRKLAIVVHVFKISKTLSIHVAVLQITGKKLNVLRFKTNVQTIVYLLNLSVFADVLVGVAVVVTQPANSRGQSREDMHVFSSSTRPPTQRGW